MKERKEQQELLMRQLLDDANIPALSLGWYQKEKGTRHAVAYGQADTSTLSPVDTNTLFQAASLSKPVSAAIVLDLIDQGKWDLDTPLADIADYGPPELRQDPHYRTLTTRMVIGQCSGLANYGQDGDDGKKFIATPNTRFTYSGVGLDFLKQVIEQKTGKEWEEIAQDFFKKAGMKSSTFQRQLLDGNLHDVHRDIAKAHMADPSPDGPLTPLSSLPDDERGVLAGSMLTNAEDYIAFLQYCFKNEYLKSTLLTGALSTLPPTNSPETSQIEWGLGMGVYRSSDPEQTIAFHWGNNTGSISFCAMDMATGDCVVNFSNSMNGPTVFQQVVEPIVGDITPLFQWLSKYCGFNDINRPEKPIATTVQSIHLLEDIESQKLTGSMQKMLLLMPSKPELKPVESQQQSTNLITSASQKIANEDNEEQKTEEFKPTPFSTSPDPYK
jgi:CubicO group peptidase (beta-lactamase class C family)